MTFEYLPPQLAAIDDQAGLRIELNRTFYDETTVRLDLKDLTSGRTWTFPIVSVEEAVSYETPGGTTTSRLPVEARLPSARIDAIVRELIAVRASTPHAFTTAEAAAAIEQGVFAYLSRGGVMLKFVPQFKVTWE
jgi:hypothetical protein